jgi:hypothetical protein
MLAMEEYDEESTRLEFLTTQRDDLVKARDDLQQAIREINRTAKDLFNETFNAIRENFQTTFQALFEGGECDLRLEDPDDPLESPIEIAASPKGKRTQRIHLLSGGERALTALALLFAIYLVKPSPFCVLDEVDAPLDEVEHPALHRHAAALQGAHAVRGHHAPPAHHGGRGLAVRRDHGGAGHQHHRRREARRGAGNGRRHSNATRTGAADTISGSERDMANYLVTGAAGFIGANVVEQLTRATATPSSASTT